jgi:hypothetical protein
MEREYYGPPRYAPYVERRAYGPGGWEVIHGRSNFGAAPSRRDVIIAIAQTDYSALRAIKDHLRTTCLNTLAADFDQCARGAIRLSRMHD